MPERSRRAALFWAVVGAALFVGMGSPLPVWEAPPNPLIIIPPNEKSEPRCGSLWWAMYDRISWAQYLREQGVDIPLLTSQDVPVTDLLALLAASACAGLACHHIGTRRAASGYNRPE